MDNFDKENEDTKMIRGEIRYYKTKDVAEELCESESTIRFWCESFKDSIDIERTGRNRQFTRHNIEELKYIQSLLRDEGYSVEKVKDFLTKSKYEIIEGGKANEPLAIHALASAVASILEERVIKMFEVEEMKRHEDLIALGEALSESQTNLLNEVKQKVSDSLVLNEEVIKSLTDNRDLNTLKQDISTLKQHIIKQQELIEVQNEILNEQSRKNELLNIEAEKRDLQLTEFLKERLEKKEETQKKGFFGKMFGR